MKLQNIQKTNYKYISYIYIHKYIRRLNHRYRHQLHHRHLRIVRLKRRLDLFLEPPVVLWMKRRFTPPPPSRFFLSSIFKPAQLTSHRLCYLLLHQSPLPPPPSFTKINKLRFNAQKREGERETLPVMVVKSVTVVVVKNATVVKLRCCRWRRRRL